MKKELFFQYRALDEQLKTLEKVKDDLRSQIVADMTGDAVEKVETEYGIFTVASRAVFKYTEAVKKLEEKVKLAKIKEEQKGTAERSETKYLVYSKIKL